GVVCLQRRVDEMREMLRDPGNASRTTAREHPQILANGLVNFRKKLPSQRLLSDSTREGLHPPEQDACGQRLGSHLGKNALMKDVEELRHAYEKRYVVTVKCIGDALRRYR